MRHSLKSPCLACNRPREVCLIEPCPKVAAAMADAVPEICADIGLTETELWGKYQEDENR